MHIQTIQLTRAKPTHTAIQHSATDGTSLSRLFSEGKEAEELDFQTFQPRG